MAIGVTLGYDATHANIGSLPKNGQKAGYVTGSAGIEWTAADFTAHPSAIRIDQSPLPGIWDSTADVDDYENGAVNLSELAGRAVARMASFVDAVRPGQREPAIYMSASNVTAVVNALLAGGIKSGVGLWIAHFGITEASAVAAVQSAAGPFPIIAFQYQNGPTFDFDVFSDHWVNNVSKKAVPPPADWSANSGWVKVNGTSFWFNHNAGTLGYEDNGVWRKINLP
jgi:type IV secretory pathway TrbD component